MIRYVAGTNLLPSVRQRFDLYSFGYMCNIGWTIAPLNADLLKILNQFTDLPRLSNNQRNQAIGLIRARTSFMSPRSRQSHNVLFSTPNDVEIATAVPSN